MRLNTLKQVLLLSEDLTMDKEQAVMKKSKLKFRTQDKE